VTTERKEYQFEYRRDANTPNGAWSNDYWQSLDLSTLENMVVNEMQVMTARVVEKVFQSINASTFSQGDVLTITVTVSGDYIDVRLKEY
jgi:hypothetical protein